MATLIPAFNSCKPRMTTGERRLAERLEAKLEDDYLLWYDVAVGPSGSHPDFLILHPRRGILVLEVKDWKLENLQSLDKLSAMLVTPTGLKRTTNPFEQARVYAHAVVKLLEKDPALVSEQSHPHTGKLRFPWSYGVVLSNITRAQFQQTDLGEVLPPQRVICKDEMTEAVSAEDFQQRLWDMFPWSFGGVLTLPQIDRIRWHLFPEIRLPAQAGLFEQADVFDSDDSSSDASTAATPAQALPDLMRIMDLQQEQLARSLGDGHRVIHGVAGSGKTMILGYRCLHLAKVLSQPILVLCYNVVLATRLQCFVAAKGIADKVCVANFHAWCAEQLKTYHIDKPVTKGDQFFKDMVQAVIDGVERGQIPAGQYGAVLIDEGHDFEPAWFKLVVQMVSPETNALLVLYDDAQSLYGTRRGRLSFKSLGIQAQGRTTILKLNYRNTAEVLQVAHAFAKDVMNPEEADDDSVPLIAPESAQRHGPPPLLLELPSFNAEVTAILERFRALQAQGYAWGDMAVVYRHKWMGEKVDQLFRVAGIPASWLNRDGASRKRLGEDAVSIVTLHSSKGLEFPVVAIPGVGYLPNATESVSDEARLMYVGMTRAMEHLVMTCHQPSPFADR
ncbi:MAG TPA: 3'-5' exonuclease, partial [Pseudomonas sp.]|nr:3'-5' exonuclease [Pseudomonas sp.]